jgi:hypothetical protein
VTNNSLMGSGIWGDGAVGWALLLGERRQCNKQDTMEAVGERRWCDGPRGGPGLQHLGTTRRRRCDERCCRGRDSGATDGGGGGYPELISGIEEHCLGEVYESRSLVVWIFL